MSSIFIIEELLLKKHTGQPSMAECRVIGRLSNTFVKEASLDGKGNEWVEYRGREKILLRHLHIQVELTREQKNVNYIWDPSGKNDGFAYYHRGSRSIGLSQNPHFRNACQGRQPTCLDLFSGIGGMGEGLAQAGFHVTGHVEKNQHVANVLEGNLLRNHFDIPTEVFAEDVTDFLEQVKQKNPAYPSPEAYDHVHASPPCQGFSTANRAENGGKNGWTNCLLTHSFADGVEIVLPLTGSMENVTGILRETHRPFLASVVLRLLRAKYNVRLGIVDASDYGDPQARKRVFLIVAQDGIPLPRLPCATHRDRPMFEGNESDKRPFKKSVSEALSYLPDPSKGRIQMENGEILYDHYGASKKFEDRLEPDRPANTVRCSNSIGHYSKDRGLTYRERAELMSFPRSMRINGCHKAIGNAVPINLAKAVGESLMKSHTQLLESMSQADKLL